MILFLSEYIYTSSVQIIIKHKNHHVKTIIISLADFFLDH